MQRAARTPGERLPGMREPPCTPAGGGSGEGLAASRATWAAKEKALGLRAALHGPPSPEQVPVQQRDNCLPDLL